MYTLHILNQRRGDFVHKELNVSTSYHHNRARRDQSPVVGLGEARRVELVVAVRIRRRRAGPDAAGDGHGHVAEADVVGLDLCVGESVEGGDEARVAPVAEPVAKYRRMLDMVEHEELCANKR